MPATPGCVFVVDVGGSHISAGICVSGKFELLRVDRTALPEEQSIDAFLETLRHSFDRVCGMESIIGAAIAIAGPFDYLGGVSRMRHKLGYLYGFRLKHAIADRFGWSPEKVQFLNDADAFLLGEIGCGAARYATRAMGITLGTGIGSAYAVKSRLVTSGLGVPERGELWNQPYANGIVEDLLSTRALQSSYFRLTGLQVSVEEIAMAAETDPTARKVFEGFGESLGSVLLETATNFGPDVIVIGGGIARSSHLFVPAASKLMKPTGIRLQVSDQIDHAHLRGAAVCWFDESGGQSLHETSIDQALETIDDAL